MVNVRLAFYTASIKLVAGDGGVFLNVYLGCFRSTLCLHCVLSLAGSAVCVYLGQRLVYTHSHSFIPFSTNLLPFNEQEIKLERSYLTA